MSIAQTVAAIEAAVGHTSHQVEKMSLDLNKTAVQIDGMAGQLRAGQNDREQRIQRALRAAEELSPEEYALRQQQDEEAAFGTPRVIEAPGSRHAPPPVPQELCVVGADGSHIEVDRHLPARCFLINSGVAALTYGSDPDARLFSSPRLYALDEELVIRDTATYREQVIEGAVLGAKRTVEEIRALVDAVRELPRDIPTLAMLDGSLVMLDLARAANQEFVLRELVEEGFVGALEELREMSADRPLGVASYISLPGSAEVVQALRLMVCSYGRAEAGFRCGLRGPGREPCDSCVGGVLDREVYSRILGLGERSAMFGTSSAGVGRYYAGTDIYFFYVNVGEEIGRVEVPSWVGDDERAVGLVHSLIIDQCHRGRGYPVALMEAHEQAVVSGADRRVFVQAVESALYTQRMPVYSSEKARSKRLRQL